MKKIFLALGLALSAFIALVSIFALIVDDSTQDLRFTPTDLRAAGFEPGSGVGLADGGIPGTVIDAPVQANLLDRPATEEMAENIRARSDSSPRYDFVGDLVVLCADEVACSYLTFNLVSEK